MVAMTVPVLMPIRPVLGHDSAVSIAIPMTIPSAISIAKLAFAVPELTGPASVTNRPKTSAIPRLGDGFGVHAARDPALIERSDAIGPHSPRPYIIWAECASARIVG